MASTRFEWDQGKNRQNHLKHGVAFELAQLAFADPNRVVAEDPATQWIREALLLFWKSGWRYHDGTVHIPRQRDPDTWRRLLAQREKSL